MYQSVCQLVNSVLDLLSPNKTPPSTTHRHNRQDYAAAPSPPAVAVHFRRLSTSSRSSLGAALAQTERARPPTVRRPAPTPPNRSTGRSRRGGGGGGGGGGGESEIPVAYPVPDPEYRGSHAGRAQAVALILACLLW